MLKPDIILFDWDGTLVDSYDMIEGAHDYALEQLGEEARPSGWFKEYFGKPREFIYQDVYAERGSEARKLFEKFVQDNHKGLIKPMTGAAGLLDQLAETEMPIAVVSNKRSDFIHAEVEHLGWEKYFTTVIGAGDAKEDKPSPEPVYEALRQSSLTESVKKDILYIGDTDSDMKTAQNVGCPWILVGFGAATPGWVEEYLPLKSIENCTDLAKYLLQSVLQ